MKLNSVLFSPHAEDQFAVGAETLRLYRSLSIPRRVVASSHVRDVKFESSRLECNYMKRMLEIMTVTNS